VDFVIMRGEDIPLIEHLIEQHLESVGELGDIDVCKDWLSRQMLLPGTYCFAVRKDKVYSAYAWMSVVETYKGEMFCIEQIASLDYTSLRFLYDMIRAIALKRKYIAIQGTTAHDAEAFMRVLGGKSTRFQSCIIGTVICEDLTCPKSGQQEHHNGGV